MRCRAVCCVGSGQRIKQFFNFCLYLCQLHLISCQLWIDLFLSTMAYLEISEPVTHSGKNELFKFFFADFSTARTAFIFCPFGTPEISDAVWNMGGFQGISAMSAFDFFRQARYFSAFCHAGKWYLSSASFCISAMFQRKSVLRGEQSQVSDFSGTCPCPLLHPVPDTDNSHLFRQNQQHHLQWLPPGF